MCMRLLFCLAFGLAAAPASAVQWDVKEQTLDNGLRVLVRTDDRAPTMVSQVWYAVGSSYEHAGITGISHLLEHMMFKGTEKHPPGEFSAIISRNGGRQNAFTGRDYTAYFEQLAADRLELALRLEADRMVNLKLSAEALAKEREVVKEERRMRVSDQPRALFAERFATVAYPASPYAHPIIGWPADLDAIGRQELADWYRRWYSPGNATLVVVGDVEPKRVFELARRYFGDIPAGETPPRGAGSPFAAPGARRLEATDKRISVPQVTIAYDVPSGAVADDAQTVYALMMMAQILDGGEGARLSQELVRDRELAAGAGAAYNPVTRLADHFTLQGTPAAGTDVSELEFALLEQVHRLRETPVAEEELERARNQLLADQLYGLDSMFRQAMQIGMLETVGIGWEALQGFEAGVRGVTAERIQATAERLLRPDRRSIGVLRPAAKSADGDAKENA